MVMVILTELIKPFVKSLNVQHVRVDNTNNELSSRFQKGTIGESLKASNINTFI